MLYGIGFGPGGWESMKKFLALAGPYVVQQCCQWWFWELLALIVGLIDAVSLAAHVSFLTLVALLLMVDPIFSESKFKINLNLIQFN